MQHCCSISVSDSPDAVNFSTLIPSFEDDLRRRFKTWAGTVLPGESNSYQVVLTLIYYEDKTVRNVVETVPQAPPTLLFANDGTPLLPLVELDSLPLRDVKSILTNFITTAWSESIIFRPINALILINRRPSLATHYHLRSSLGRLGLVAQSLPCGPQADIYICHPGPFAHGRG
jgi:hypothetical protein